MAEIAQTTTSNGAVSKQLDSLEAPDLVVYGCGTQGRVIIEFLTESLCFPNLRLTDDDRCMWGIEIFAIAVMPPLHAFHAGPQPFVCAIGENRTRRDIFRKLIAAGHKPVTVRHASAIVSPSARLGEGSILTARTVVNTEARVGDGCLLNTGCVVEHHCDIGDFAHLAPGVLLGGGVKVGAAAMLGLGAVVLPGLSIGSEAVVGAGAVVTRNVPPGAVVAGNPAVPLRPMPSQ